MGVTLLGQLPDVGTEKAGQTADLLERVVVHTAVEAATRALNGNGKKKKPDYTGWAKYGITLLVTLLVAWWGFSQLIAERPVRSAVKEMIDERKPHPDSVQHAREHDVELKSQQRQLDHISGKVDAIYEDVGEIKQKLNQTRRRR